MKQKPYAGLFPMHKAYCVIHANEHLRGFVVLNCVPDPCILNSKKSLLKVTIYFLRLLKGTP